MGIEAVSGDTLCDEGSHLSLESMHCPEPVISMAIQPERQADREPMSKALNRFVKEDPTFHAHHDDESGQTLISGMGELHLEVYVERMRREYKANVVLGAPKVQYRETPTVETTFNHKHKKQTGGSGQYAHVTGRLIPLDVDGEEDYVFENTVTGGRIPTEYIPSVDKGFQMARAKGPLAGFEVVGVKMILEDGSSHAVDSSDLAFQVCARAAFKEAVRSAKPALLEPIMRVEIEVPAEYQGNVSGDIASRRGMVTGQENKLNAVVMTADVPLSNMFGYATDLRSMTRGQGTFTMEFNCYRRTPTIVQEAIIAAKKDEAKTKS
jgi:elongation factor G